jgi:replication factor C large subunit
MNEPLTEKYRPESVKEVQGNNKSLRQLTNWLKSFEKGDEAQMLAGPPGVGKTSTVHALANDFDLPVQEVNASDARRSDEIAEMVGQMKLTPITEDYQLILFDEADSISGRTNLKPLKDLLDDPPNPIIVVCNEEWEVPGTIKSRCNVHDFKLDKSSRLAKLREIAAEEDLELGAATLGQLADRENLRDAIQDLQQMADTGEVMEDTRDYGQSPFEVLDDLRTGRGVEGKTDETPPDLQRWIDSGLRGQYRGLEAQVVWDLIARADKWLERAGPNNNFRYWFYAGKLQKQIAEVRLTDAYDGYVRYGKPSYVRVPSATSESNNTATLYREVAEMESGRFGVSCNYHEFREVYLPILLDLDLEERRQLAVEHGLSDSAKKALDLDPAKHEEWAVDEGDKVEEGSVFDW